MHERNNKAVKHFIGEEKEGVNQRLYDSWYSLDTILYLSNIDKHEEYLRYVFFDSENDNSFKLQLKQLDILKEDIDKPACFISKEPGAGQNHYIFGIFIKNNLVVMNPIGLTAHKDFYNLLKKITGGKGLDLSLSNTTLQFDTKGLVSCGPICVELMRHISRIPFGEISYCLQNNQVEEKDGLQYRAIDISNTQLLPSSLKEIIGNEEAQYRSQVENLRRNHLEILINHENLQNLSIEEQNNCLDRLINSEEQILINKLCLGDEEGRKVFLDDIRGLEEYIRLKGGGMQGVRKQTEEDERIAQELQTEDYNRSKLRQEETIIKTGNQILGSIKKSTEEALNTPLQNTNKYSVNNFLEEREVIDLANAEYAIQTHQQINLDGLNISILHEQSMVEQNPEALIENNDSKIQKSINLAFLGVPVFFAISNNMHWVITALLPTGDNREIQVIYMNSAYGEGAEGYQECKKVGLENCQNIVNQINNRFLYDNTTREKITAHHVFLNPTQQMANNCGAAAGLNIASIAAWFLQKNQQSITDSLEQYLAKLKYNELLSNKQKSKFEKYVESRFAHIEEPNYDLHNSILSSSALEVDNIELDFNNILIHQHTKPENLEEKKLTSTSSDTSTKENGKKIKYKNITIRRMKALVLQYIEHAKVQNMVTSKLTTIYEKLTDLNSICLNYFGYLPKELLESLLVYSCKLGHINIVRQLVQNVKLDPNCSIKEKSSERMPLELAVQYSHKEVIEFLLTHGSKVTRKWKSIILYAEGRRMYVEHTFNALEGALIAKSRSSIEVLVKYGCTYEDLDAVIKDKKFQGEEYRDFLELIMGNDRKRKISYAKGLSFNLFGFVLVFQT